MQKSFRCAVALLLLTALCLTYMPLVAQATSQSHPNTHVNTGDQRSDVIAVALTQVGYLEGPNNDNKYGVWYGYNNIAWCGIYVAWCADQAGVPTSVLARTGLANPDAYGLATEPAGYVPLPGDLFFAFDNSHVGFVYYVDGDSFYSLEGNTSENGTEGVFIRKHALNSVRFASPKYQGGGSHNYELGNETEHPHKEFYRCTDCGDQYYTGKTGTGTDCVTCIQASCSHSFGQHSSLSDTQHTRVCANCGMEETASHVWNAGSTVQAANCAQSGRTEQTCLECGALRTLTVPATGNHSYSAWELVDDNNHCRTCVSCGREELLAHDIQAQRQTDETSHWYECATCGEKISREDHAFGEKCDSACEICEYVRPEGHRYSTELIYDDTSHWRACEVCGLTEGNGVHQFDTECDETCASCAYERQTQHIFSTNYSTDSSSHWYACGVCGAKDSLQAHTPEEVNRQGAIQHCTVCQLQLTSDAMHTHGYDQVFSDQDNHWGSCSCGLELEPQAHQWSVKTEACTVCGQAMAVSVVNDSQELIPWIAGGVAILAVGCLLLILLLRKRK